MSTVSTVSILAKDRGATRLRLRLIHSAGEPRNASMLIPPAGAGMADALELCGECQSDAQWRVANLCRIAWQEKTNSWTLSNGSFTMVCVRNGERVQSGSVVPVAAGDTIELGLLRFVLEEGDEVYEQAKAESPFELQELEGQYGEAGGRRDSALTDPFGVLDIAGARSRPATDTLAEMLGETRRREVRSAPVVRQPASSMNTGPAVTLLDELHEEFVRVVQDPDQLAGRADWEGFLAVGNEPAPSLELLSKQAETYPLLRDILSPREGIDRTLDTFEPFIGSALLDMEPPREVLALFAPDLARETVAVLPSLTRREHHAFSPDSHVRMGGSSAHDDEVDGTSR
ncbi:TagK domain-containing protein [Variovorax boronicumulans]|uniref:TagK domain-containing protein n=1 Tax=Variovorax boronicumulans TaxID=436515 RepID=UPI0033956E0B